LGILKQKNGFELIEQRLVPLAQTENGSELIEQRIIAYTQAEKDTKI